MPNYYETLELPKTATDKDIRKAYKRLAMKWHPDKNQNKEDASKKFQAVSEAYSILSDPEKKKLFDSYGEDGLKYGGPPPSQSSSYSFSGTNSRGYRRFTEQEADAIFRSFFASKGYSSSSFYSESDSHNNSYGRFSNSGSDNHRFSNQNGPSSDFYGQGNRREYNYFGGNDPNYPGSGRNVGSGNRKTFEEFTKPPPQEPKTIEPLVIEVPCDLELFYKGGVKKMKITRTISNQQNSVVVELNIKPGMSDGTKFTYRGIGDQLPGYQPQDVSFILKENHHPLFTRSDNDIILTVPISLKQALTGLKVSENAIDGEKVTFQMKDVINPSTQKVIPNKGMPILNTNERGNMIFNFDIKFPDKLSWMQQRGIKKNLPD